MAKRDWLIVGLKLLGMYFGVLGASNLWGGLITLMVASSRGTPVPGAVPAVVILQPALYLVAAFFLVCKTRSCLSWSDARDLDGPTLSAQSPPIA